MRGLSIADMIRGCKLYYNWLLDRIDLPLVFECSPAGVYTSYAQVEGLAEASAKALGEIMGHKLSLEWHDLEVIGRKFKVNKFFMVGDGNVVGELRVVEENSYALVVSGAMTKRALALMRPEVGEELRRGVIVWGEEPQPVYVRTARKESGMPPGQKTASRFVIYAAEGIPQVSPGSWRLKVRDESARGREFTLEELEALMEEGVSTDFHCVTGWSVKNVKLEGIPLETLLSKAGIRSTDGWLVATSVKGYSTVMPLREALEDNSLIVLKVNGRRLAPEHGFPARIFVPSLYGWKSAKWLSEIIVFSEYIDGFWEALGYHERGKAEYEERFKIRNPDYLEKPSPK